MAKLTKKQLRDRGIYNSHNFCAAGGGVLSLREGEHHNWLVVALNFKTDPDGPWYNYGSKSFFGASGISKWRERSADALREAQSWASEHYGIADWKRDPFGGWQDSRVYDAVMGPRKGSRNAERTITKSD